MFEIWDVHGRAAPYALRPPKMPAGLAVAQPTAPVKAVEERQHPTAQRAAAAAAAAYKGGSTPDAQWRAPIAEPWMSRPVVTLAADTPLLDAWTLFRARQFRHVPVVDASAPVGPQLPVGMLSDRDLLLYFADRDGTPTKPLPDIRVKNVMKTNILTARPGTSIHRIAHVMVQERLGAVPIVDPKQGLVGLLTRSDILRLTVELTTTTLPAL